MYPMPHGPTTAGSALAEGSGGRRISGSSVDGTHVARQLGAVRQSGSGRESSAHGDVPSAPVPTHRERWPQAERQRVEASRGRVRPPCRPGPELLFRLEGPSRTLARLQRTANGAEEEQADEQRAESVVHYRFAATCEVAFTVFFEKWDPDRPIVIGVWDTGPFSSGVRTRAVTELKILGFTVLIAAPALCLGRLELGPCCKRARRPKVPDASL
ncbi:hypothetical protein T492DRAFT_843794 [Pavlovales sp. CCMP2436]|nr:hypothetical protein T492DRAFT_843794 [Pavlovales sp. CCMP2436]